jgi:hypothetical protein
MDYSWTGLIGHDLLADQIMLGSSMSFTGEMLHSPDCPLGDANGHNNFHFLACELAQSWIAGKPRRWRFLPLLALDGLTQHHRRPARGQGPGREQDRAGAADTGRASGISIRQPTLSA